MYANQSNRETSRPQFAKTELLQVAALGYTFFVVSPARTKPEYKIESVME
jgi:hypothetical protein